MARILIVDGSPLMRQRLAELVREVPGVTVVGAAGTAGHAVSLAQRMAPDLVVLDLQLPDGDSLATLQRLRSGPAAPVVVGLCSGVTPQHFETARRLGAGHVLDELHDFERIADLARELVAAREVA